MRVKLEVCILISTVILVGATVQVLAAEGILLEINDPVGDDRGPGYYEYPTEEIFSKEGLFDITRFRIKEGEQFYIFDFEFSQLTNPWQGKFGFSLPLIELYIDNQQGGATDLLREGANIRFNPRHPWNKLLKVSGWWVRLYEPADRIEQPRHINIEDLPWDLQDYQLETRGNTITLKLEKQHLGSLEGAHIYVLVGGFDPFGLDHFREVTPEADTWSFGMGNQGNPAYAPRVIDIVLPSGMSQAKVLGDFENDYPEITPIKIVKPFTSRDLPVFLVPGLLVILILLVLFIYRRFDLF